MPRVWAQTTPLPLVLFTIGVKPSDGTRRPLFAYVLQAPEYQTHRVRCRVHSDSDSEWLWNRKDQNSR